MDDLDDHVLQLLWRYNREAVALRIQYLMTAKMGQESHTVLVSMVSDRGRHPYCACNHQPSGSGKARLSANCP